jgi:D-apiose dehydrogenase
MSSPAKLRVAVVGAGYYSRFHLEGWRRQADLVGVCDLDGERAAAAALQFGAPRSFTALSEMLDALRPDLLDVVVPPAAHATAVALALDRGIATICQKPFTGSWGAANELARQAAARRTILVVHENFRFCPWFREARRLIESGRLGHLHNVAFRLRPGDGQGAAAYLQRQPYFQTMPRLLVVETAIHLIDTFRYLIGEVGAVYARLRRLNPVVAGEDAGLIVFEFASGASGVFDGNRLNEHPAGDQRRTMGEMWLEGSAGVLRLDGEARLWFMPHGSGVEDEHVYDRGDPSAFGGGASAALQAHVLRHLDRGTALENSAADYLANLRVQEAIYHSHSTGQRIEVAAFVPAEIPGPVRL